VTYNEFFKLAERVEDLSRHLYLTLAGHQATPPAIRELLLGLAAEEEEHARRLQLLASTMRRSQWSTQLVQVAEAGLKAAADEFEAFLGEVRTRRRPGDLIQILDRLGRLEERLSFVHAEELARGLGPEAARIFESMARQDRRHQKLLEQVRRSQSSLRA